MSVSSEQIQLIPLDRLLPWDNAGRGQPRQHFDEAALRDLADSIRSGGFIGSITVRPFPGRPGYMEILAGHRRTRAAALAGLAAIPATVQDLDDQAARWFVLQDNLQRADFLCWEEGDGFAELLEGGLTVAEVAGRIGKSADYIRGRVKLHQALGETARKLHLRRELGIETLLLLADLPDRNLSPVECPRCHVVNREGAVTCASCGADLSAVWRCEVGNPQDVAARACRGCATAVAAEKIVRVRESHGIADKAVQTSLGFDDLQISQDAIAVRTELERQLDKIAKLGAWVQSNAPKLEEYTPGQRAAIAAQCEAGEALLRYVREVAVPPVAEVEFPALAMAL